MNNNKNELKIIGLTQRIGEITSKYELQIIDIRADMTIEVQRLKEENRLLKEEIRKLEEDLGRNDVAISKKS